SPRIVQVGESIPQAGAEMQKSRCRPVCHAVVAIGRASRDAFKEAQYAAHTLDPIEGRHEMHLGRSWIREADVHPTSQEGADETLRAIHSRSLDVSHGRGYCAFQRFVPTSVPTLYVNTRRHAAP